MDKPLKMIFAIHLKFMPEWGIGLHADVKITSLFHPGIGWAGIWKNVGSRDRYSKMVFTSLESALFPLYALSAPFIFDEKKMVFI